MPLTIVGGSLVPAMNIDWSGGPPVTPEDIDAQVAHAKSLALPSVIVRDLNATPGNGRKLAVVGGGPSIADHKRELQEWDGDVWAINGAYHWCKARGIDPTFIACDPHIIVADWAKKVTKALITTRCHGDVFKELAKSKADVRVFDLEGDNRIMAGSSTACASFHLAFLDGYRHVTFFGCESSYAPGVSHAYMHEKRKEEMLIDVEGEHYHTAPDFFIQALEMASVMRLADNNSPDCGLYERSGGLLRAFIEAPEIAYRIVWVSQALYDGLGRTTIDDADQPPALEAAE
jgi:hypothetical protein